MKNKILIIDDDADFVDAISLLLQSDGYEVITASNGTEGFQKVKRESPDLIFLDMMMTYKTEGAETAQAMAEDAAIREIPVVMVTGARKEADFPIEVKADKDKLPVKTVIEKPVKPEALLKLTKLYIKRTGEEHRRVVAGLDDLAKRWEGKKGNLIMILHEIQNHHGYVPREIAFELSRILDISLARIYEVITFYNYFKLDPPGEHTISVCMGTACYLKGAPQIVDEIKNILNVEEGQTTADGVFHLQMVRCLGCCGLAPVVMIDETVHGKVKKEEVMGILSQYSGGAEQDKEAAV
ncbi:MAG: NAD(P)H-dependent oxidoreductase subunit E [Candidatus Omnitrophota bacterium]